MSFAFRFSNLCGPVFKQGHVVFAPDGTTLLSPVGNRISAFDLAHHQSFTFPFEARKNIVHVAVSPNGTIILTVDEDGRLMLVNYYRRAVLAHFNFKEPVHSIKFSPDGSLFAVGLHKKIEIWKTPSATQDYSPFVLYRRFNRHFDDVTSLDWSTDGEFLLSGSRDMTIRVSPLKHASGYVSLALSGHRDYVVRAFFGKEEDTIYSVSVDARVFVWKFDRQTRQWAISSRERINETGRIRCAAYLKSADLLVVGFDRGLFGLYQLPTLESLHTLSISNRHIDTVDINSTGEWLVFGSQELGQLLVWEWRSETYVLKQQGHSLEMSCMSYSPDGQRIVTGGEDGKVKVWNVSTGFCFITFSEHQGAVSKVLFSPNGHSVVSASRDGTVRAFDLLRYRNYRVLTSPEPRQFASLALDPAGEIAVAGTSDSFEIYVWSLQTGRLLDVLSGHAGPVSGLAFHPFKSVLASSSWDRTVKLWDVFEGKGNIETLLHNADVLALAFRPDGEELCSASLDGFITLWDHANGVLLGQIEGRNDIAGGRKVSDVRTAKGNSATKSFRSLSYTADGQAIIAGGISKYVCIYHSKQRLLIKKFQLSSNRSLDGVLDFLNSAELTEAGAYDLLDVGADRRSIATPGLQSDAEKRSTKPAIRCRDVGFSPTGRQWCAVTTEGLAVFSLDETMTFDPFDLDLEVTPENIHKILSSGQYLTALVMALRLNEVEYIKLVAEAIPIAEAKALIENLPPHYLPRLIQFLASNVEKSPHVEFHLVWILHVFTIHGRTIQESPGLTSTLRNLQKNVTLHHQNLSKLCDDNRYTMRFLSAVARTSQDEVEEEKEEEIFETTSTKFQHKQSLFDQLTGK